MLEIILFLPSFVYFFYVANKYINWYSIPVFERVDTITASIIVPIKNEENNIERLVIDLQNQVYPSKNYEVIIVNDHSTDDTFNLLDRLDLPENIKALELPEGIHGKKQALDFGIKASNNYVIITLDADTELPKEWLSSMLAAFEWDNELLVNQGPVVPIPVNLLSYLQFYEAAATQVFTASGFSSQRPKMASGANFAFKRQSFYEVNGYERHKHLLSGDDVFLIEDFNSQLQGSYFYTKDPRAMVRTKPADSCRNALRQRLRWAGKWKHYIGPELKWQALLVYFFNLYFMIVGLGCVFGFISIPVCIASFSIKILIEGTLTLSFSKSTGVTFNLFYFALMVLLYPIYAVIFGLASLFARNEW